MRTTIDIDEPILKELKELQKEDGKSLGRLVSDLLAKVIGERKAARQPRKPSPWIAKAMGARIDLADRDALLTAMDEAPEGSENAGHA